MLCEILFFFPLYTPGPSFKELGVENAFYYATINLICWNSHDVGAAALSVWMILLYFSITSASLTGFFVRRFSSMHFYFDQTRDCSCHCPFPELFDFATKCLHLVLIPTFLFHLRLSIFSQPSAIVMLGYFANTVHLLYTVVPHCAEASYFTKIGKSSENI